MSLIGRYIKVIIQALAWLLVGFILIVQLRLVLAIPLPTEYYLKQSFSLALLIIYYYTNEKIFVPRLLFKQKLATFISVHVVSIALIQVLGRIADAIFQTREKMMEAISSITHIQFTPGKWSNLDATLLLASTVVAGISTCIALVQIWQTNLAVSEEIKKKQVDAELALLKAQIHPHFFFNTLNNIYALSFDDVEVSRTSLYKLSRMMRYLLYETPNNQTFLSKEIEFVKDYIELMSLRMTETMHIVFEAPEKVIEKRVAPMILLPFIENAFKHGVSSLKNGTIIIKITQNNNILRLYVENKIFKDKSDKVEDGGIGLSNTERRLDVIYPNQYTLHYQRTENDSYIVELELQL